MVFLKPILWVMEYFLKAFAGVAAFVVLASQGSFISRVATAFLSVDELFNSIVEWPSKIAFMNQVVSDYHTLTAARFNSKYGNQALDTVLTYLNDGLRFIQQVYENISLFPVKSILSTLLVFLFFYFIARLLRFVRQKGQGSLLTQKEREWGNKIFTEDK